jgi:hypothetical protein
VIALLRKLIEVKKRRPQELRVSRTSPRSGISSLSPGRIALGYAVIAILWIAFSDAVVTQFALPPVVMTIKGTVFVFVTASLFYFAIRRLVQSVQLTSQELRTFVDHAGDSLFVQDFKLGTIVDVNRQACESLGLRGRSGASEPGIDAG